MSEHYQPRILTVVPDLQIGNFTLDGAWHLDGIDLSAIVPAGASHVILIVDTMSTPAYRDFYIRTNSTSRAYNFGAIFTTVTNTPTSYRHFILPIDADRKMDYFAHANLTAANVKVAGWFISTANYHYVPRNCGAAADFTEANFTLDGAPHVNGLDLSAIIPVGTVAVTLRTIINPTATNRYLQVFTNNVDNVYRQLTVWGQVASQYEMSDCSIVMIDADRKLDYCTQLVAPGTILLTVTGWFI